MKTEIPYSESLEKLIKNTAAYAASVGALVQTTVHMCVALCQDEECEAYLLLRAINVSPESILAEIQGLEKSPKNKPCSDTNLPESRSVRTAITSARRIADTLKTGEIHTGHILFGILNSGTCIARHVLREKGVKEYTLLNMMQTSQTPAMA